MTTQEIKQVKERNYGFIYFGITIGFGGALAYLIVANYLIELLI